jgi:hypothetical protein
MIIELSDEQPENASASIRLSLQFDSNVSVESRQQEWKDRLPNLSMREEILTLEDRPKYRITDTPPKSRGKSPRIEKCEFASAIVIVEMPLSVNAELSIISTEAGIQIDLSDEHRRNASASIRSRWEFDWNVKVESDVQ